VSLFESNDPEQILREFELFIKQKIDKSRSILFLDEIQMAPELLAKLRWFAEKSPELAVIAAGSLLDFVLRDHVISMPVGRINYCHIEPLSFEEFLYVTEEQQLLEYLNDIHLDTKITETTHKTLSQKVSEFCLVGGLPEAVQVWIDERSIVPVNQVHHDLYATYKDDFGKYPTRIAVERLQEVMNAVPKMLGKKFTLQQVSRHLNASTIRNALDMLCLARVCHKVQAVAGDGLPLLVHTKDKYYKIIMVDVALIGIALGLGLKNVDPLRLSNNGEVAEQLVGQLLRCLFPLYQEPGLYYWVREDKSSAEVDYLIQHRNHIIPVEVKAGSTGQLRSLHQFMHLRKLRYAVRVNNDVLSVTPVKVTLHDQAQVSYTLLSIPFYLIGELPRLLDELLS